MAKAEPLYDVATHNQAVKLKIWNLKTPSKGGWFVKF